MPSLRLAPTYELDRATLTAAQRMVVDAFPGNFDDHDWEHALGGVHALVEEDGSIVAHGAVVQRRLLHGGRALRTGYVEAVAVRPDRQRRGIGAAVMQALLPVIRGAYTVGALAASERGGRLYRSLGWQRWQGATWVLSPEGLRRTDGDDDAVYVLPMDTPMDLAGDLVCDWRDGDVW